jgi:hypothetical protein
MAVNLSPVGGVAAQFFDNSGNVLTGGLLYSYLAGTTTPAVTYTSSNGITAQSNPIVLDAAGRVPNSGEIWLTDGISYKFVLQDQNSVQIATWDNIVGINSNFIAYTGQAETQTATQGQTVFTLTTIQYKPGANSLAVFVNGSKQVNPTNFIETSSVSVTFVDGLNVGDVVEFDTASPVATNAVSASNVAFTGFKGQIGSVQDLATDDGSDWIGFLQSGTGAVAVSAQDKMRQFVSVKDFGAIGNGTTDDTAAIQAAITAVGTGTVYFPYGTYKVTSTLNVTCNTYMQTGATITTSTMASDAKVFNVTVSTNHQNIAIQGDVSVDPANGTVGFFVTGNAFRTTLQNCKAINLKYGFLINTFSVGLYDCRGNTNTTNLSAYASSVSVQINDLKVIGGNYADPLGTYSIIIGDSSFTTTVPAGDFHGTSMVLSGFALDGGTLHIESYLDCNINSLYFETPTANTAIEIENNSTNDGYVSGVNIYNCYFKDVDYAIYCHAGVKGFNVGMNSYSAVNICALYISTDIYPYTYTSGFSAGSFGSGPEVHTGQRQVGFASCTFSSTSLPSDSIFNGTQTTVFEPTSQLQSAIWRSGTTIKTNALTYGRRYKTPTLSKAGSLNGFVFTLTTASDAGFFNAGDVYDAGAFGGGVINKVDYDAGTLNLSNAFSASPAAGTVSQVASAWV